MRSSTTTGLYFALSAAASLALISIVFEQLLAPQDDPLGLNAPHNLVYLVLPMFGLVGFVWFVATFGARLAADEVEVPTQDAVLGGVGFAGVTSAVVWIVPTVWAFLVTLTLGPFIAAFLLVWRKRREPPSNTSLERTREG